MQAIVKQRARGYYDNHNKEVIQIMELKRVNINEIPVTRYTGQPTAEIEAFLKMDADAVEIVNHHYKSNKSCHNAFSTAARRMNCGVKVIMRDGRVFLVKHKVGVSNECK